METLDNQIKVIEDKIKESEDQIKESEEKLKVIDTMLAKGPAQWTEDEKNTHGNHKYLRDKEKSLRDEKKSLRDKEKSLRDEKILLMRRTERELEPFVMKHKSGPSASLPSFQQILSLVSTIIQETPNTGSHLVSTTGARFSFLDRTTSFQILSDSLKKSLQPWEDGHSDRNHYPIPFLAGGPGVGKSRFLQELPGAFRTYVSGLPEHFSDLKNILNDAAYVNITFGNGTPFSQYDTDVTKAVSFRILYQYLKLKRSSIFFESFYKMYNNEKIALTDVLSLFKTKCVVLGIDEVNKVHGHDPSLFKTLFHTIGGLRCDDKSHFFVPIFAGTVIGPMKNVVSESTHRPLPIPLPLLSFDSALAIVRQLNTDSDGGIQESPMLEQLIWEVGGHCRSLEILYDSLGNCNRLLESYWDVVFHQTQTELKNRYQITSVPLGTAIAYSFLSRAVKPTTKYPEDESFTFQDLQEKGLIMLGEDDQVQVPFIFTHIFLQDRAQSPTPFTEFWTDVLFTNMLQWKGWEKFNQRYLAFRMSLYAFLGQDTISLKELFKGATIRIPGNITIKVPTIVHLKKAPHRYPSTDSSSYGVGEVVLNADGAPFDAFMYVEKFDDRTVENSTGQQLLLALQMKLSHQESTNRTVVTKNMVEDEYWKMNNSIATNLVCKDFVCVMLCCNDSELKEGDLPEKTVFVSRTQHAGFYGENFARRLAKVT